MNQGDIVQATVNEIVSYGAFVTVPGHEDVKTLLHLVDIRWRRVNDEAEIKQLLSVGDTIQVQVLKYDSDHRRATVGLKQLTPDPWENINEIKVNKILGTIMHTAEYGLFVEVSEGIEGFLPATFLPMPPTSYTLGSDIRVNIATLDIDNRRIQLTLW